MSSDAVGSERVSRIVGYKITKGNFSTTSPNLPQRVIVLGEANTANQSGLVTTAKEITSAKQAGDLYGYGSPIYHALRILRPFSGDGIGGIPTYVIAQAAAGGSAAKVMTITVTGTATANTTHTVVIGGRYGLDGTAYDINIETGDTNEDVAAKIEDAINAVLGCPVSAEATADDIVCTAKWTGLTSQDITITVDNNGTGAGVTYAVVQTTAGSGTPAITTALTSFANDWNTIVVNTYGTVAAVMTSLESFNGRPDPSNPTGRFSGTIMKPCIALTGSVADDPSSVTDAKLDDCTIAICPAPGSAGMPLEAAANMCLLFARTMQDNPHLDVSGQSYPDMPVPASGNIGSMATYTNRDAIVKKGCSTVELVSGRYQVQDFVTTYHPVGELPPQFRYCRNLMLDFNVRFGYYLLELIHVKDHTLASDGDTVSASGVVKPKQWKKILLGYAEDLGKRALIADVPFMQNSITVNIGTTNPDRFETFFRYKRTGIARILSTTAEAGFNFGTV